MSRRARTLVLLSIMLAVVVAAAAPAAGAVTAPAAFDGDVFAADGPAVEVPPDAPEAPEHPWTARFLAPLVLVLGVGSIAGALLYYGVRIRGRYRVTP